MSNWLFQTQNLGKRFGREWIFRNLNLEFQSGENYAITGANGSGKSTLLKILTGAVPANEGTLVLSQDGKILDIEQHYQSIALAAPYIELIEELTLPELLEFHFSFQKLQVGLDLKELPEILYLQTHLKKPISTFSSGMKQRVRLGLAFFSQSPLLLLDEPTTNLDLVGQEWYRVMLLKYQANRITIIASNDLNEYQFDGLKSTHVIKMG
jgi:ABC-type multidrug transport system ATPase subunit